ncbi:MAG: hypothetical protein AAGH88_09095 [Planctomycetota bacterium]
MNGIDLILRAFDSTNDPDLLRRGLRGSLAQLDERQRLELGRWLEQGLIAISSNEPDRAARLIAHELIDAATRTPVTAEAGRVAGSLAAVAQRPAVVQLEVFHDERFIATVDLRAVVGGHPAVLPGIHPGPYTMALETGVVLRRIQLTEDQVRLRRHGRPMMRAAAASGDRHSRATCRGDLLVVTPPAETASTGSARTPRPPVSVRFCVEPGVDEATLQISAAEHRSKP